MLCSTHTRIDSAGLGNSAPSRRHMDHPLSICYEDEDVLVINKPAGLVVHSDGRTEEETLSNIIAKQYPTLQEVGGLHTLDSERYVPRVGILHRLDRETSGLIAIAKHDEAFYFFQRQFLDRSIKKEYRAFVSGVPEPHRGVIDLPIGRSRSDFRKWATGEDARGTLRPATSHYEVLESYDDIAFLALRPTTGRTHQLRVHLSAVGHPILHDPKYGGPEGLGFERLALHAFQLTLRLMDGSVLSAEAPLPDDFVQGLELLRKGAS